MQRLTTSLIAACLLAGAILQAVHWPSGSATLLMGSHIQETGSVEIIETDEDQPGADEEKSDTLVAMANVTGGVAHT